MCAHCTIISIILFLSCLTNVHWSLEPRVVQVHTSESTSSAAPLLTSDAIARRPRLRVVAAMALRRRIVVLLLHVSVPICPSGGLLLLPHLLLRH